MCRPSSPAVTSRRKAKTNEWIIVQKPHGSPPWNFLWTNGLQEVLLCAIKIGEEGPEAIYWHVTAYGGTKPYIGPKPKGGGPEAIAKARAVRAANIEQRRNNPPTT